MFSFSSNRSPDQRRILNPELNDIVRYADSKIELRKNAAGKIELTATKPGFFEHLGYSFRAYFYPNTVRKEKNKTTKILAQMIKDHLGNKDGEKVATAFAAKFTIEQNKCRYDNNPEATPNSPVLISRLKGAQLKVALIDQTKKLVLESYSDENREQEIARSLYCERFKNSNNQYRLPTQEELVTFKSDVPKRVNWFKTKEEVLSLYDGYAKKLAAKEYDSSFYDTTTKILRLPTELELINCREKIEAVLKKNHIVLSSPAHPVVTLPRSMTEQKKHLKDQDLYFEKPISVVPKEFLNVQNNPEEVLRLLPTLSKSNQEKLLNRVNIFNDQKHNPDVFDFVIKAAKELSQIKPTIQQKLGDITSETKELIDTNNERIKRQQAYTKALLAEIKSNPIGAVEKVTVTKPSKTPLLSLEALSILNAIINKCTTLDS